MKMSKIIEEITIELKKYFNFEEARKFYSLLKEVDKKEIDTQNFGPENTRQINKEIKSGSSIRDQIDKVITFAENRISTEDYTKLLLSIAQLMVNYGEFEIAYDVTIEAIDRLKDQKDNLEAEAFLMMSRIAWNQGDWNKSLNNCSKSRAIYSALNDDSGMSKCENMFGTIYGEQGKIDEAHKHFELGLNYVQDDNFSLKAMFNNNLGILSNMRGKYSEAKTYYLNALNYYTKLDEPKNIARLNHNIGMLYSKQDDFENAINYFDESIIISLEKGYLSNCAISFIAKAYAYSQLGRQDLSDAFAEKAFEIAYKLNDRLTIADVYRVKGVILKNLDNYNLSEEFFENSIRLNEDFKNSSNVAESTMEMSSLYNDPQKQSKREELIQKAMKYYKKINADIFLSKGN